MEGTDKRGRPRKMAEIQEWHRMYIYSIYRAAQNRELWSKVVRTAVDTNAMDYRHHHHHRDFKCGLNNKELGLSLSLQLNKAVSKSDDQVQYDRQQKNVLRRCLNITSDGALWWKRKTVPEAGAETGKACLPTVERLNGGIQHSGT